MSLDDAPPARSTADPGPLSNLSRRTLMKTAGIAGVAVAVAGSVGIANAGTATSRQSAITAALAGAPVTGAGSTEAAATAMAGPVVVHVMNAHTGTLEVFGNGTRTAVHNADLAARISRIAGAGPVVVHVVDAGTGSLDVFSEGSSRMIRNRDLAHRILHAA